MPKNQDKKSIPVETNSKQVFSGQRTTKPLPPPSKQGIRRPPKAKK